MSSIKVCLAAALQAMLAASAGGAWAQAQYMQQPAAVVQPAEAEYQRVALKWARGAAEAAVPTSAQPLALDVSVGPLDSRLHLAPCATVEAYLPPGGRLWGHSRVGLRCVDGLTKWNVSVALTVKAVGKAWIVRTPVASGSIINQSDVVEADVDWADDTNPVLQDMSAWLGAVATRPLTTGQTLRQGMVRAAQVFQPGAPVRVITEGVGFQASADAQALSAGVVGQPARVRMDNGRVATGTVLDSHTVKMEL